MFCGLASDEKRWVQEAEMSCEGDQRWVLTSGSTDTHAFPLNASALSKSVTSAPTLATESAQMETESFVSETRSCESNTSALEKREAKTPSQRTSRSGRTNPLPWRIWIALFSTSSNWTKPFACQTTDQQLSSSLHQGRQMRTFQ